QQCGATAPKWQGRCPGCGESLTLVEELEAPAAAGGSHAVPASAPVALSDIRATEGDRVSTGIAEFDRPLGGGLVRGSIVLLGGEPGIGKSTLLLQAAVSLARSGTDVLYVCGEESPAQVRMRAERLGAADAPVRLLPEVDVRAVEATAEAERPGLLVVDSIQTAYDPDLTGAPGSVGQVRACTTRLMRVAKDLGITTVLVGHVTKEGAIAGPRVLEHMVDTVLYFEGDRDHAFRIVRAVKNRFGSSSEIGVFEMREAGLAPVEQPSAALLAERAGSAPGSVIMPLVEGARPLLVEVQALVSPSFLPQPRRLATGIDTGRLLQVLAVLERRAGLSFGSQDVYATVAGGVRVGEPAVDLPLALALASSLKDAPLPPDFAAFGELGLTGEVRP
ncbi:MAG: DNA repair protein RadA, partial [Actinobacteria bacterium]